MIKKLATLVVLLLAVHFVVVAGGVAYLVGAGKLNKEAAGKIREALFPPEAAPATQPSTQPVMSSATTRPLLKLEELLAKQAGRPATEQVEFIRNAFDEQYAQLERRMRELEDLQRQIEFSRSQIARDRSALDERQKSLDSRETEAARLERDQGFQTELKLYETMPAAQVKKVLMGLDEEQAARYLQAMQPRTAAKILKEFKTQDELSRMQAMLDRIRKAGPSPAGGSAASGGAAGEAPGGGPGGGGGGAVAGGK